MIFPFPYQESNFSSYKLRPICHALFKRWRYVISFCSRYNVEKLLRKGKSVNMAVTMKKLVVKKIGLISSFKLRLSFFLPPTSRKKDLIRVRVTVRVSVKTTYLSSIC